MSYEEWQRLKKKIEAAGLECRLRKGSSTLDFPSPAALERAIDKLASDS